MNALEKRDESLTAAKPEPDGGLVGWRFGKCIRGRRRELGLSLMKVAAQAGTSGQLLSKYERGEVLPRAPIVIEGIASALSLPPEELAELVAVDRRTRKAIDARRGGNPRPRKLAEVFQRLLTAAEKLLEHAERIQRNA